MWLLLPMLPAACDLPGYAFLTQYSSPFPDPLPDLDQIRSPLPASVLGSQQWSDQSLTCLSSDSFPAPRRLAALARLSDSGRLWQAARAGGAGGRRLRVLRFRLGAEKVGAGEHSPLRAFGEFWRNTLSTTLGVCGNCTSRVESRQRGRCTCNDCRMPCRPVLLHV